MSRHRRDVECDLCGNPALLTGRVRNWRGEWAVACSPACAEAWIRDGLIDLPDRESRVGTMLPPVTGDFAEQMRTRRFNP